MARETRSLVVITFRKLRPILTNLLESTPQFYSSNLITQIVKAQEREEVVLLISLSNRSILIESQVYLLYKVVENHLLYNHCIITCLEVNSDIK